MLTTHTGKTFRDAAIVIDRQRFVHCEFINCQLIFTAADDADFEDCTFSSCAWLFDGSAERTLTFLATIANEAGPNQRRMVERVVESIFNRELVDYQEGSADSSRDARDRAVNAPLAS